MTYKKIQYIDLTENQDESFIKRYILDAILWVKLLLLYVVLGWSGLLVIPVFLFDVLFLDGENFFFKWTSKGELIFHATAIILGFIWIFIASIILRDF